MRITVKGQVTIPLEIREKLGLLPDTEVEFEIDRDAVRIRKATRDGRRTRGRTLVEHMRGRATRRISTDEIMNTLQVNNKSLVEITGNLKEITKNIRNGQGTLGKLITDDAVYANLEGTLATLQKNRGQHAAPHRRAGRLRGAPANAGRAGQRPRDGYGSIR